MDSIFNKNAVKRTVITGEMVQIISSTILIAVLSQIIIPFKPVPFTGQTLGILLSASLLGRRKGLIAVSSYILLGTLGMPFFAGGDFGLARLAGPTGGYLIGFVAATYIVGLLSDSGMFRTFRFSVLSMLIGNIVIYSLGILWLSKFVGWDSVLSAGVYPFIPGDMIKILLASSLIPFGSKYLK